MPSRNTLHHSFLRARSANILASALRNVLAIVDDLLVTSMASATTEGSSTTTFLHARGNTWSRATQRKRLSAAVSANQEPPVLRCSIECCSKVDTPCGIIFTRLEGKDRSIFESFTSHILLPFGLLRQNSCDQKLLVLALRASIILCSQCNILIWSSAAVRGACTVCYGCV
ncbi:hypothetical protein K503DRAFT_857114 [Rhizopogon vinicolor AM-OR11-026]|uniref:Uncharacterized protein n=1 Tax=Rhizopogon vinicolor AM-OR11-026 TaxID=1314800 RepID=A0A1B7MZ33_9AGAM|nr:hypothetical protein K503DRAFT_857114 [Rhizopogon vinicolor AM-OR11-026]